MLAILFRQATALMLLGLAGCSHMEAATTDGDIAPEVTGITAEAAETLSQSPMRRAVEAYKRSDFGLAERYFRAAVEHNPRDAKAWIGLAASYDQLRRFELADRAYNEAIQLSGETAQLMNNIGYSLLLRGDLKAAQAKFARANRLQPNETTLANMRLIDSGQVRLPQ
jgi:Flp pilus assembly protein TadD